MFSLYVIDGVNEMIYLHVNGLSRTLHYQLAINSSWQIVLYSDYVSKWIDFVLDTT